MVKLHIKLSSRVGRVGEEVLIIQREGDFYSDDIIRTITSLMVAAGYTQHDIMDALSRVLHEVVSTTTQPATSHAIFTPGVEYDNSTIDGADVL